MTGLRPERAFLVGLCLVLGARTASAQQISYTVTFDDPDGTAASYYSQITQHIQAAGARWNTYLRPAASVTLEVQVKFSTDVPLSTGRSPTSSFVRAENGINIYEQGAAAEIRTGRDPNQTAPDIEWIVNPDYLKNQLWFDPNPSARTAVVPGNKTDAMSVFLHELGHALAFNGWRDGTTGTLPANYESTFDQHVTASDGALFFNGSETMAQYGNRPVPVTTGNPNHLGNREGSGLPGQDLIPDLMNGVVFTNGTRYDISALDVAILADSEVPVLIPVPEPGSILMACLLPVAVWVARQRHRVRASRAS